MTKEKAGRAGRRAPAPRSLSQDDTPEDSRNLSTLQAGGDAPQLQSFYAGRTCLGFLLARGKQGIEAFDADEKSLGIFPNAKAAAAVIAAARAGGRHG